MPNNSSSKLTVVTDKILTQAIYRVRSQQVMLDSDLAILYGVTTKAFNQAVKRNLERFTDDCRFKLTGTEHEILSSKNVTSTAGRGGRRYLPYAFTEQGVAMLSSVLNSDRAIQVNIAIMRAFVNMRRLATTSEEINKKLAAIEKKLGDHDNNFKQVFAAIRAMIAPAKQPKQIGYIQKKKEDLK